MEIPIARERSKTFLGGDFLGGIPEGRRLGKSPGGLKGESLIARERSRIFGRGILGENPGGLRGDPLISRKD